MLETNVALKFAYITFYLLLGLVASGQKPMIDQSCFGSWPLLNDRALISNDGSYFAYEVIGDSDGHSSFYVKSRYNAWRQKYSDIGEAQFSSDSKLLYLRKSDSLYIVQLGTNTIHIEPDISFFKILKGDKNGKAIIKRTSKTNLFRIEDSTAHVISEQKGVSQFAISDEEESIAFIVNDSITKLLAVEVYDINKRTSSRIWQGKLCKNLVWLDKENLLFLTGDQAGNHVKVFNRNSAKLNDFILVSLEEKGVSMQIDQVQRSYGGTGEMVIRWKDTVSLFKTPGKPSVDIWSYHDPILQSSQLLTLKKKGDGDLRNSEAFWDLKKSMIFICTDPRTQILGNTKDFYLFKVNGKGDRDNEWNWNRTAVSKVYLCSKINPASLVLMENVVNEAVEFKFTPSGRYVLYYDPISMSYWSYNCISGKRVNLTKGLDVIWNTYDHSDHPDARYHTEGTWRFVDDCDDIIVYDRNGIWRIDVTGIKSPTCLTSKYGVRNHLRFRFTQPLQKLNDSVFVATTFNRENKENGLALVSINGRKAPVLLTQLNAKISQVIKAAEVDEFILKIETASNSANYFTTKDFKEFRQVSTLVPEKNLIG